MAYKEIVTKAVIGKGKKKYKDTYQVAVEQTPSTILGCWIINHNFKAQEDNGKTIVMYDFGGYKRCINLKNVWEVCSVLHLHRSHL